MSIIAETLERKNHFKIKVRAQKTLDSPITLFGKGLFTGEEVEIVISPARASSGIFFQRVDLEDMPTISATTDNLFATPRCTILGNQTCKIICVEHLLSAIAACGLDNVLIQVRGEEIPIFDGSSLPFVEAIDKAGILEQEEKIEEYHLLSPLYLTQNDMQIVALPSESLQYSYTLSYPHHPILSAQFYHFEYTKDGYKANIAPGRTFSPLEEVKVLVEKGLLKSDSLDHGVILDGAKVMNPRGLRFDNEMVRHKILDMMGDLSLTGFPIVAHFIGIKSGHSLNTAFAKILRQKVED